MQMERYNVFSMHPALIPTIAAVAGASFVVLYAIYRSLLPKPIPGIPYNEQSAKRLLGDIPELAAIGRAGGRRKLWWADMSRKHNSPIVQFFFGMGAKPGIILTDYREVRDLVMRSSKEVLRGGLNCDPWLGLIPGHFIAMEDDHPQFKSSKALSKDLMGTGFLHNVSAPASYEMVLNLIRLWEFKAKVAGGSPFDADDDVSHLTFDIMLATACGISPRESSTVRHFAKLQNCKAPSNTGDKLVGFPKQEDHEFFDAIYVIQKAAGLVKGVPNARLFHLYNNNFNAKMRKAVKVKNATLRSYVNQAKQRVDDDPVGFKPASAVDYMVSREIQAAEKAGTEPALGSIELRDGLLGFILGGQDSTHSTICYSLKRLGESPGIQLKLRKALYESHADAYRHSRQPTTDEISKTQVDYLDAFIQEVLRSTPPGPALARTTAVDLNILGHFIPKGTIFVLPLQGPTFHDKGPDVPEEVRSEASKQHQGVSDWAESSYPGEEFLPERWLRSAEGGGEPVYDATMGPFMTFGNGKRSCWGQRLAYLELKLIMTLLVWNFQFDQLPAELHDWEIVDEAFSKPKNTFVRIKSLWNA